MLGYWLFAAPRAFNVTYVFVNGAISADLRRAPRTSSTSGLALPEPHLELR